MRRWRQAGVLVPAGRTGSRHTPEDLMLPVTPSRRLAAQASLIGTPVLMAVSTVFMPDFGSSAADRLAAVGSTQATISAATFVVAQLPLLVAILAIGLLLVEAAPRLSAWGTALGVLGCFGHTVWGGTSMMELVMARDASARSTYAALLDNVEGSPVMVFAAVGLLSTVLGFLLLSIGLFRSRTGPVWVGPALWAFLLLEFVGSNFSDYAMYLSGLLFAVAFFSLVPLIGAATEDASKPYYADQHS
jgi:hypothetical protein